MKRIIYLFLIIIIASCTTQKSVVTGKNFTKLPEDKTLEEFVVTDCKLKGNLPNMPGSLSGKFILAGKDSLQLRVFAMFGIEAAKVFMSQASFTALSPLQSIAYKGVPKAENLKEATGLSLSFKDLVSIIRSEVPGDRSKYKFEKELEGDRGLFRSKGDDYVEFITVDGAGNMASYSQVSSEGVNLLKVNFSNYEEFSGKKFAKQISIEFPKNNLKLDIEAGKIDFITPTRLSFDIPDGFNIKQLN